MESEDGVEVQGDGFHGDWVYCIPLESVGLGGNQITSVGATALADGLKSNTSESVCMNFQGYGAKSATFSA